MAEGFRNQVPSSVLLEEVTETWALFRMPCACHTPDHDLRVDLEYDPLVETTALRFYYPVCTRQYLPWWKEWFQRLKLVIRLLKKGDLTQDGEFLFSGPTGLLDLIETLLQAEAHFVICAHRKNQKKIEQEIESYENLAVTD